MFNLKLNKPTAKLPFPLHSMIFAPMEGVTNATYRRVIRSLYPEWDALCADFIRVPSNGLYPTKFLIKHIGKDVLENSKELQKTMVQILTSPVGRTFDTVQQLVDLGVYWLDLNIGCPSGTVVKHQGGSYWLKETAKLFELVQNIRALHPHFFSVKMRIGFENSDNFLHILKEFEALGVDAITVHARTREQMYSTPADWSYIKAAVETVQIPIIANGDIWTIEDKEKVIQQTGCHSAMIARGALKCPWLPQKMNAMAEKKIAIAKYFHALTEAWQLEDVHEVNIVKKIKELSRYLYEDVEGGENLKRQILLSKNFEEQKRYIYEYSN
jgi:tRNA-dihydrouridine synthase